MENGLKGNKSKRRPKDGNPQKDPPKITGPWGRAASQHRPGLFAVQYFKKNNEICCADFYRSLCEEIDRINEERIQIGEKPFRRPNYSSISRYFHWFAILGLIERTGRTEPSEYPFLRKRVFYRLTDKGRAEVRAWEDPISVAHPEFR
jgi:hypothetical protein